MAAAINPAHGERLPHSKFTTKQAQEIRARIEFKRARLEKLRIEREAIEAEISELIKTDTVKQLSFEFGVSKTTIERIGSYASYWRR
jgi:septal ring factor EnvC (AmiA/AmiB activator)